MFVYDTEQGKVAVKMDYDIQHRDQLTQKKQRVKVNMVRTASTIKSDVEWNDFKKSYDLLWGNLD
ncbi:hypothetical protein [Avibacterium paragallinarum]|uniref:hypothetical protein n=1 Tax=Avibacterium paragallinarum TaxID=728 RepID=UPI00034D9082|nr:hypothetical protein [Avibacterium paragallinarum]